MLNRKRMSQCKIAKKLGLSRNTVKKDLDNPKFPESRGRMRKRKSLPDPYKDTIETWIEEDMDYTATGYMTVANGGRKMGRWVAVEFRY